MCKDTNQTAKHSQFTKANRKMAALAAIRRLDEEAKGVAEIRKAFEVTREQHRRNADELVATEQLIEQMEDAIVDEAMTLAELEDDHDEGCGCSDEEGAPAAFDDEEEEADHSHEERAQVPRLPARRPGIAPLIFGALGVACAVASMVARTIADEHKE